MSDLLTTAQVAAELGTSPNNVRRLATSRSLGTLYGNSLLFSPTEVDAMRERKPGRPPKPQHA